MKDTTKLLVLATIVGILMTPVSAFAARGTANFSRYVAIGDSTSAGSQSANPINLVETHQKWSLPAIVARQAGAPDFQQPLISEPGILPELVLESLVPLSIAPKSSTPGTPLNLMLPRPYNNLGIPGARVSDLLTLTGAENHPNPFYAIILRGLATTVEQAAALHPTFISVWIGNNDVLGGVTSGSPLAMTSVDDFTRDYNILLDSLIAGGPDAGMVAIGILPVARLPFSNTIPPFIVDPSTRLPVLNPADGSLIYYVAELGDGSVGVLPPGSRVNLTAQGFLASGYGIPAPLAPFFPPLPNIGKPLPGTVVLDAAEFAAIEQRQMELNAVIATSTSARNIPLIALDPIFERLEEGIDYAGLEIDLSFVTGGTVSLDGIHPTSIGNLLIANELIKRINQEYDATIPLASLTSFLNDAPPGSSHASFLLVPSWMTLNLTEVPWPEFTGPQIPEMTVEPEVKSPIRRGVRRSGGGR